MRVRRCQCLLACALLINVIALYYFWRMQSNLDQLQLDEKQMSNRRGFRQNALEQLRDINLDSSLLPTSEVQTKHLHELVSVIIREFDDFENDIEETVRSLQKTLGPVKIFIVADKLPYPPLQIPNASNIKVVVLSPFPEKGSRFAKLEYQIHTPYVLLVPDAIRMTSASQLHLMITSHWVQSNSVAAARVQGERSWCYKLDVNMREWTIKYTHQSRSKPCDALVGPHLLLMQTQLIFNMTYPFERPFPQALFIQTTMHKRKIHVMENTEFQQGKPLFLDPHLRWKRNNIHAESLQTLYEKFGIKKVIQVSGETEWYGCTKHTPRCFGTVVDDTPSYLYVGRWTPPCCLEALRKTTRHVLNILHKSNVRHWLEGGSLLGAARSGDIIPWDYDVDIGIYQDDITKCSWLRKAAEQSTEDDEGFIWEKATEGDFFRVQYSKTNRLHVDIFPFYVKGNKMTKNTWLKTHRQDMEFPESFLRPTTTISFVGMQAAAPNNIRDFLELKFGEGVIESPKYPNPDKLKYLNSTNNL